MEDFLEARDGDVKRPQGVIFECPDGGEVGDERIAVLDGEGVVFGAVVVHGGRCGLGGVGGIMWFDGLMC